MTADLLFKKAIMQLKRGLREKAKDSLLALLELEEEDMVSEAQARCLLGELLFLEQKYQEAREYLTWILDQEEELLEAYDDLLNEEVYEAQVLLEIMDRNGL